MTTPTPEQFDQFCLVELMGRQRLAGRVTERVIAGQGFLEVSVPETSHSPKFTRFIAPGSIYALNPIDEATMRAYAENLRAKPIDSWDIGAFMKKVEEQKLRLSGVAEDADKYANTRVEESDDSKWPEDREED